MDCLSRILFSPFRRFPVELFLLNFAAENDGKGIDRVMKLFKKRLHPSQIAIFQYFSVKTDFMRKLISYPSCTL